MIERISELDVERLAHGELSRERAAAVRAALGDHADERVRAIVQDNAATLMRLTPARVAATVRQRLGTEPRSQPVPRWWIPMTALAAASLAVWFVVRTRPSASDAAQLPIDGPRGGSGALLGDPTVDDVVRIKGDAAFMIDRSGAAGPERLGDGARVKAGDRLQLQYRAGESEQGVIVSIDGRAVATLHFPAEIDASPRLRLGGLTALDHSYELDDAPGFERFFFVTAAPGVDLDLGAVMRAAQRLAASADAEYGALVLPSGHEYTSLRLDKRAQ